jgi:hypothetical protein
VESCFIVAKDGAGFAVRVVSLGFALEKGAWLEKEMSGLDEATHLDCGFLNLL